jgi:hypothetical protein
VRHRGKIESTINNARRVLELREEFGSLAAYAWRFEPRPGSRPKRMTLAALKKLGSSAESAAMSKDLKKRGWSFVGPTTVYAFMQAMGLVNDHIEGCHVRALAAEAPGRRRPASRSGEGMTIPQLLSPHTRDLGGGFTVRRLLPSANRASVGPFVFFDHFGPIEVAPESNFDVRPHPHIGLATVTYLFDGAMMHRDSTGVVQRIEPGAVNWMTAGRGIVHVERRPKDLESRSLSQPRPAAVGRIARGRGGVGALVPARDRGQHPRGATRRRDGPRRRRLGVRRGVADSDRFGRRWPWCSTSMSRAAGRWSCRRSPRSARSMPSTTRSRSTARRSTSSPWRCCPRARRPKLSAPRGGRVALVGRRAARPPLHVLELRLQPARADPRRRGRLEAQRFDRIPGETEFIPLPARRP